MFIRNILLDYFIKYSLYLSHLKYNDNVRYAQTSYIFNLLKTCIVETEIKKISD